MQKNVRALDDSIGAIKQKQSRLQDQIEGVQNSTEIMSNDLQAALEQLEDELYPSDIPEQPEPEIMEIEPPEPSSSPSEPNSMD